MRGCRGPLGRPRWRWGPSALAACVSARRGGASAVLTACVPACAAFLPDTFRDRACAGVSVGVSAPSAWLADALQASGSWVADITAGPPCVSGRMASTALPCLPHDNATRLPLVVHP